MRSLALQPPIPRRSILPPKRARLGEGEKPLEEQGLEEPRPAAVDTSERPSPAEEVEKMAVEDTLPPPAREEEGVEMSV